MTVLKKWKMAKILLVCSLPSSSIFITTTPLPEMHCVRSNAIRTLGGSPNVTVKNRVMVRVSSRVRVRVRVRIRVMVRV